MQELSISKDTSKAVQKSVFEAVKYNLKKGEDDEMKLSEEARLARNKYLREWRKGNKEAVKKHQNNYWEKKAAQAEAAQAEREVQP